MSLVSPKDLYENTGLKKLGILGRSFSYGIYNLLGLNDLNALYIRNQQYNSPLFEAKILADLGIEYEVNEDDLKRIPAQGPFILVANHPLGGLDGIIMLKILSEIRPDFKIIANFLLHQIDPLKPRIFPVNPFETRQDIRNSVTGMKDAFRHVKSGHPLGIFPAGEVSQRDQEKNILDREWQEPVIKLIKKAGVPIIPMYFKAKNSEWFYRLGKLHPDLQTSMLVREMLRPRIKPIKIRIGKPISVSIINEFDDIQDFAEFLRRKTYVLDSTYNQPKSLQQSIVKSIPTIKIAKAKKIISETSLHLIQKDIQSLQNTDNHLFTNNNYECFFASYPQIPNIMREIGRLREITFRDVGEGTDKETDTDKYDKHYSHLILWDNENQKIAGAYRMGMGKQIYEKHGISGFYINELFIFEPEIQPFFSRCIEMGRAFVVKEYQQKPWPLFLLWRGIMHVALRHPEHKYILGGVSISNQFSEFSKALMIEFMRSHYYDPYVAQFIRPRKEFKPKIKDQDKEFIFDEAKADLNKFDKLIEELEPNALRLPVLIKKYIKQNAKVIGFNVDPKFNDAIDGLMYIRMSDIPESTIKPAMEDLEKQIKEGKI
ncbi:MAG: lysophospholipid acyltransferase family protein [Flavobacteriaceae bacterium]|nr:lysophospholipid acyltransferase family protein [Flavobacteriaceae bacterium]